MSTSDGAAILASAVRGLLAERLLSPEVDPCPFCDALKGQQHQGAA